MTGVQTCALPIYSFIDDNVKLIEGAGNLSKEELTDRIVEMIEGMVKEKVDSEEEE